MTSIPPGPISLSRIVIPSTTLTGLAGSPGVAVAPSLVVDPRRVSYVRRRVRGYDVDGEVERFREAVGRAQDELRAMGDAPGNSLGRAELSIVEAYVLMLGDDTLGDAVERNIRINRQCVEWAVSNVISEFAATLGTATDAYLRDRSRDFEFVGERLLLALSGPGKAVVPTLTEPTILVARDLSPADLLALAGPNLRGVVTELGTRTSHTALLARAFGVPAVLGVRDVLEHVVSGERVVVDGLRGTVTMRPSEEAAAQGQARGERHRALTRHLLDDAAKPCVLASGESIQLLANIELSSEAEVACDHGADGIGLFRTEYLYVDRDSIPSEEEQVEHYRAVVQRMAGKPVTFRTFDLGGDKASALLSDAGERNPALGARAVRLALQSPDLFRAQLRAMARASADGPVRIMIPMVSSLREWAEVKVLFSRALAELDATGATRAADIPLGLMIEVPSAALLADAFAKQAAFFSLGTNDLVQYTLAVDRTNPNLAHLASPFDPAVLRLIKMVCDAAARADKPLSVCGAMASDPIAAIVLIGLGVRGLSMEPAAIPELKEALSRVSLVEAQEVATLALDLPSADDIEHLVAVRFAPRLFDLLSGDEAGLRGAPSTALAVGAHGACFRVGLSRSVLAAQGQAAVRLGHRRLASSRPCARERLSVRLSAGRNVR